MPTAGSGFLEEARIHYAGSAWLYITNDGSFGSAPYKSASGGVTYAFGLRPRYDLVTLGIRWLPSFEFPSGTKTNYLLQGSFWFGAVRGLDTLVSTCLGVNAGNEFLSFDTVLETSSNPSSTYYDPTAVADQTYFVSYSDTVAGRGRDELELRPHRPIGVEVHQSSLAWSAGPLKDVTIIDTWIINVSSTPVTDACMGLYFVPSAVNFDRPEDFFDEMTGLLRKVPGPVPGTVDTVNIAWMADNDGDPFASGYSRLTPNGALGIRILQAPQGAQFSFNWWAYLVPQGTWGPRLLRDRLGFAGSLGEPRGDRGRYHMMTNGEVDYDQAYAAFDYGEQGWSAPLSGPSVVQSIASGTEVHMLLSYGPIRDIAPGDSVRFTYALIAAEDVHTDPWNFRRNFSTRDPRPYLNNLDFSDLITNACAADWFFDTPGVDTDGDGYRGKYFATNCNPSGTVCDTVWYKGDGVPDWSGPKAPPYPSFELTTQPHTAILRWDGVIAETTRDLLSRRRDFEGYRVYSSRFNTPDDYALIASWDKDDNFTRWAYQSKTNDWKQVSYPLTIDEWRSALNDPTFDPVEHARPSFESAYRDTLIDTVRDVQGTIIEIVPRLQYSYWVPEGPNRGNRYFGADRWEDNLIQKVGDRDTIIGDDTLTYGVYEMTLGRFNSSIPLYFAVTAFDYGDYARNVTSLESSPHANSKYCHLLYSSDVVVDSALQVSVYPNPYKIQFKDVFGNWTSYYRQGYEGLGKPVMEERDRRIWFINLPDTAEINIYTLDGDLVREILHPDPFLTTYSSVVGWDLISRNTQAVVSGIYIWRVDSRLGKQIGKLVIIK